jgi:hypothetical protein
MGVCLGIYFNVFTLSHAFGFNSLRSKWIAPIFLKIFQVVATHTSRSGNQGARRDRIPAESSNDLRGEGTAVVDEDVVVRAFRLQLLERQVDELVARIG